MDLIDDFLKENVQETIENFSNNFNTLDELHVEHIKSLESLQRGDFFPIGERFFNSNPKVNDYIGWVNVSSGVYAPKRESRKVYVVGDLVVPSSENGHAYECLVGGTSAPAEPLFPTSSGSTLYDTFLAQKWAPSYNYDVGDIITLEGNNNLYYECVTGGLSSSVEPNWVTTVGTTFLDETVVWLVNKTVQWKEYGKASSFRPYGKIE